jgi:serine/threonine-protein kinase
MKQDSAGLSHFETQPWDASAAPLPFAVMAGQRVAEIAIPRGGHGYFAARMGFPGESDIWIAPLDSPKTLRPYLTLKADEYEPSVSPDGKWLAYVSDESGRPEVYVRPMPGPGARLPISTDGGSEPIWSPKPGELFYRGSGKVILAHVTNLERASTVTREALFDDVYTRAPIRAMYDVSPDGSRLLFTKATGSDPQTIVVLNWFTEVKSVLRQQLASLTEAPNGETLMNHS